VDNRKHVQQIHFFQQRLNVDQHQVLAINQK